ncbi:MAG: hypothetical protein WBI17_10500 [Clostridiaceae bacterium]
MDTVKNEFNPKIFKGLLIQGKLLEGIAYLKEYPEKDALVQKYNDLFREVDPVYGFSIESELISNVLTVFHDYYRRVFWENSDLIEAESILYTTLREIAAIRQEDIIENDRLDELVGDKVRKEGYEYLGGMTSGYYGPYIWRNTNPVKFEVELPGGTRSFTVNMMDGFISRSWLDYISFGETGTGGWANESGLYCVESLYKDDFLKPQFKISFLKHESQHQADLERYGNMHTKDLEYRAKLVELIYYPDLSLFEGIIREADGTNKENAHCYASYVIVRDLSRKIFQMEYASELKLWDGKLSMIQSYARELLDFHTKSADEKRGSLIDLI